MAVLQGVKEKVHFPIYDSIFVEPEQQLREVKNVNSSILKFFVDVQSKTKLETNLQSASLLPHYNTFEARAMRIVISDFTAEFPDRETVSVTIEDNDVLDKDGKPFPTVTATLELGLDDAMDKLREAQESDDGTAKFDYEQGDIQDGTVIAKPTSTSPSTSPSTSTGTSPSTSPSTSTTPTLPDGGSVVLSADALESAIADLDKRAPASQQIASGDGGRLIRAFLYNTVATLYVGEKIMIQAPTWLFPAGAGPFSDGNFTTHGEPSPTATFRFAEPVNIDKQQNFRVEIEVPDSDVFRDIQKIYGPFNIWVLLDGYMTRDVQ